MIHSLADLQRQLQLERLEVNLFRGESRDTGSAQVFGGQVLGQALMAAHATIEGRTVHSLHAYFLRRGDFKRPIVYSVDRSRDGGSFSTRRVIAVQNGEQIFICSASFQIEEQGLEYQATAPRVPPPEELQPFVKPAPEVLARLPEKLRRWLQIERPFEFRPVQPYNPLEPVATTPPVRQIWLRAVDRLPDDDNLHRCLLAYVSDYWLLDTSTMPHGSSFLRGNLIMASIDHAIWFHRAARVDEWLLYCLDSPSSSGARGFARGSVYTRDGVLVASTAQEGLIRLVQPQV